MNEQNPPPDHIARAEYFQKIQLSILLGCLAILLYLLVALDSANLFHLLLVLVFMALPLTIAFFMVGRQIRYWEKPFQLYSREFSYKPALKSGIQVPIQVEYQFPTAVDSPDVLHRIHAAAEEGLDGSFSQLADPGDYEATRKLLAKVLEPEIKSLEIEVFRIHIAKIQVPSSQYYSFGSPIRVGAALQEPIKSMAARAH